MKCRGWKQGVALGGLILMLAASGAHAQSGDAILDLLIKKGVINQREANEVREQLDKDTATAVEAHSKMKTSSWLDVMTLSGDLRLRGEFFDNEDQSNTNDRTRFRYRLRLGLEVKFVDWATVGLRLASGESAPGDPVSTNQSMTDTFKKKPITIDAAFARLQPPGWDWLTVTGGKMDLTVWQPKFNSPMQYDFDVTPEGVAEQLNFAFGANKQHRVFANFGQFALKELSTDANDPFLFDCQTGIEAKFGSDVKNPKLRVTTAVGFSETRNLVKTGYVFGDSPNKGNANGGSAFTNNFLEDFSVLNVRGEVAALLNERPFLGTPVLVTAAGEYDENLQDAYRNLSDHQTTGWTLQATFGEVKKAGQWQVAYQYKHLEADAVWDALTDSDWGTGGTDRKGHVIKAAYNVRDWWQLGIGAFLTEKISNRANSGHNTVSYNNTELLRIQLDTAWKF